MDAAVDWLEENAEWLSAVAACTLAMESIVNPTLRY